MFLALLKLAALLSLIDKMITNDNKGIYLLGQKLTKTR